MDSIGCYTIEPKKMDVAQRRNLAKKVYNEAHQAVFNGVSFEDFYHTVFTPHTVQTKIMIYSHGEEIIGYSTFQLYKLKQKRVPIYITMTEMCLKEKAYQYHIHPIGFFVKESAKFIFQHPLENVYMVDTLVSPVVYKKLCQTAYQIYPIYNKPVPSNLAGLSRRVAKFFHWHFKTAGNFIIRRLKWKVKKQYVAKDTSVDPNKEYFSSLVPDYRLGKGLVVVVPITIFNIIATIIKTGVYRIQHILFEFLKRPM